MILAVGFLLLREPDFGAFVVITTIAFGVLFLGGVNVRVFVLLAVVAVIGFMILILDLALPSRPHLRFNWTPGRTPSARATSSRTR